MQVFISRDNEFGEYEYLVYIFQMRRTARLANSCLSKFMNGYKVFIIIMRQTGFGTKVEMWKI